MFNEQKHEGRQAKTPDGLGYRELELSGDYWVHSLTRSGCLATQSLAAASGLAPS